MRVLTPPSPKHAETPQEAQEARTTFPESAEPARSSAPAPNDAPASAAFPAPRRPSVRKTSLARRVGLGVAAAACAAAVGVGMVALGLPDIPFTAGQSQSDGAYFAIIGELGEGTAAAQVDPFRRTPNPTAQTAAENGGSAFIHNGEIVSDNAYSLDKYQHVAKTLTVEADEEPLFGIGNGKYIPGIAVSIPVEGKPAAAFGAARADKNDAAASDAFVRETTRSAAARIADCTLHVTATYTDGTTETKTYVIQPVENFDEAYADFSAKQNENLAASERQQDVPYPDLSTELYTITEVTPSLE